jgi:predicted NodU family carbamoyl transferase
MRILAVSDHVSGCMKYPGGAGVPGESYIQRMFAAEGVKYCRHSDIEDEIARLIADGFGVARCAGIMEYGPRALGNRSILYRSGDASVNDCSTRV